MKAKNKLKAEFEEWDDANRRLEFYSTLLVPANFPDGHSNILKFVKDALLHFQLIGVHFLDLFCGNRRRRSSPRSANAVTQRDSCTLHWTSPSYV